MPVALHRRGDAPLNLSARATTIRVREMIVFFNGHHLTLFLRAGPYPARQFDH